MHSSMSRSSVIMPTPNRDHSPAPPSTPMYQSREAEGLEHETPSDAPTDEHDTFTSVPTTPSLSLHGEDDVISIHSSDDDDGDDFALVSGRGAGDRSNASGPSSTHVADEEQSDRGEFDFVDESEE